jgi:hypothetical protein
MSYYMITATNKWYSYPRVAAIWIDVHHAEKIRSTRHTHPTPSPRIVLIHTYLTRSTHSNPSWVVDRVRQSHCSWEKELSTQSTACWPFNPRVCTQFLSWANQWSSRESQTSIGSRLLGLYHRHMIGTFNTCSRGSIHRSLTDTARATTLKVPTLHTPLPDLFNRWSSLST